MGDCQDGWQRHERGNPHCIFPPKNRALLRLASFMCGQTGDLFFGRHSLCVDPAKKSGWAEYEVAFGESDGECMDYGAENRDRTSSTEGGVWHQLDFFNGLL